jgi:putative acetyltransferase
MEYLIRAERPGDKPAVYAVLASAFPTEQEASLVDRLRENGRLIVSLVAAIEGELVGHVAFSPVTIDHPGEILVGAGLAPLAVHPKWQRRGIGARLVRRGLADCKQAGIGFVVVLGEPDYYQRFGFDKASLRKVTNLYGVDEPFLLIELRRDSVRPGIACYAPEFAALS